jgi:hypothetical protein
MRAVAPASVRVRLARTALEAALSTRGVVAADAGPSQMFASAGAGERLEGVVATALPGRRYNVGLHLVAALVPLHPLADKIRSRVRTSARSAGLGDVLGPIDISFEDVVERPRRAAPR